MPKRVLITGGAGFIGSHLADNLLRRGYEVRAVDNLCAQVHGPDAGRPSYLNREVEFVAGDVCNRQTMQRALRDIDGVFHFAAVVGVGQSMYELAHYTTSNNLGTAILLECLIERPVEKLVVASSMSVYGEGLYRDASGAAVTVAGRSAAQLRRGEWEPRDGNGALVPLPTPESKAPSLASVYALSKYDQERMCLMVGAAYGIPTTALRFFNAYGPRQALSNPYTGVLAIFAARLLNGNPPLIFEDGEQRRDFVHVLDVAEACRLAYESARAAGQVLNVGSGRSVSVNEVARRLAEQLEKEHLTPEITHKYRVGDIRHCFAEITRARQLLGYEPRISLEDGIRDLAVWLEGQIAADRVVEARRALERRGLTV
ncbi:MAG TPA: NAD-dependent epimerase/dehydratase family protein [Stellaceae bacterium]